MNTNRHSNKVWFVAALSVFIFVMAYWLNGSFLRAKATEQGGDDLSFEYPGQIYGRVTDEYGVGLEHVDVRVLDAVTNGTFPQIFTGATNLYLPLIER